MIKYIIIIQYSLVTYNGLQGSGEKLHLIEGSTKWARSMDFTGLQLYQTPCIRQILN